MTLRHRTMREVLAERTSRWVANEPARVEGRPVVAISRQPGAGGREVARLLAERLGLEVHDRDIIHRIAADARVREYSVVSREEQDRPLLDDWLASFASDAPLSRYAYLRHLTEVVEELARVGGAVIVGRGAHLILGAGRALRVFVVAPLLTRVATVMARHGVDERTAAARIQSKEDERRAFLRHYFRTDFGDPTTFDLVVNTGVLGVAGAADAIQASLVRLASGRAAKPAAALATHA